MAGEGRVNVREEDPSGLDRAQDHGAGAPEGTPAGGPTGVSAREHPVEPGRALRGEPLVATCHPWT